MINQRLKEVGSKVPAKYFITKYRKFNGKRYVKGPSYHTKKGAQDEAAYYRRKGLLARVVQHKLRKPKFGSKYIWTVYSRRKK